MTGELTFLWVVLGLGSRMQVVASLSITEILALAVAPFLYVNDYHYMKHDGIRPLFALL